MTFNLTKERNKEIQRKRKMMYFIEATQEIIEKEGIDKVTIRKVADLAGYNSSTIYNYFNSLDHLVTFASIQYLQEYNNEFIRGIKNCNDEYGKFIIEWKIFLKNAFDHPKAFEYVFFGGDENIEDMMREYYEIFPIEADDEIDMEEMYDLLKADNFKMRNIICLKKLSTQGYIKEKDIDIINEILICMSHEYIILAFKEGEDFNREEHIDKFISCIKYLIREK